MLIEDEGLRIVVKSTLERVLKLVLGSAKKRKAVAEDTGDERRVQIELERLQDAISSLEGRIVELGDRVNWRFADEESSDPGFADFVDGALRAAAISESEAKRLMLGRMIVERLFARTGDEAALLLNRALRDVLDMTDQQLRLLGMITLVKNVAALRLDKPFSSRDDAERWLHARYFRLCENWLSRPAVTYDNLETLASMGMTRFQEHDDQYSRGSAISSWLITNGVGQFDGVEGEIGTNDSHQRYHKRFPAITALEQMANGTQKGRMMPNGHRLDDLILTPLGDVLGTMVLEQSLAMYASEKSDGAQQHVLPAASE